MNTMKLGIALLVAFTTVAPALADTIRCESDNGRERYCRGNTRGGVYLQTQLSSSGCYQGDTWGYDGGGIWVSAGCRAIFQTGGNYYPNGYNPNNNYPNNNNNHNNGNDGAVAAVALAAIIGAAVIASSSSKNKSNSGGSYETTYNNGCNAGNKDRSAGKSRDYTRHSGSYSGSNEQAYSSGYNKCWSN